MTTEFFRTLKEAEEFKPVCAAKAVYGLDKRGTERQFRVHRDHAIACERRDAQDARAVVVIWR